MKLFVESRRSSDGTTTTFIKGINRGMVFWADVPREHTVGSEQFKRRPWLVVSTDAFHQKLPLVVAVPLSTREAKATEFLHCRIELDLADFRPNPDGTPLTSGGIALTEQVRTLAHDRLDGQPAGKFSDVAMMKVDVGLRFVLRLPA